MNSWTLITFWYKNLSDSLTKLLMLSHASYCWILYVVHTGPFKRGMLLHTHVPTHKNIEKYDKSHMQIKLHTFILHILPVFDQDMCLFSWYWLHLNFPKSNNNGGLVSFYNMVFLN